MGLTQFHLRLNTKIGGEFVTLGKFLLLQNLIKYTDNILSAYSVYYNVVGLNGRYLATDYDYHLTMTKKFKDGLFYPIQPFGYEDWFNENTIVIDHFHEIYLKQRTEINFNIEAITDFDILEDNNFKVE